VSEPTRLKWWRSGEPTEREVHASRRGDA
jgi:hypothetical protein